MGTPDPLRYLCLVFAPCCSPPRACDICHVTSRRAVEAVARVALAVTAAAVTAAAVAMAAEARG